MPGCSRSAPMRRRCSRSNFKLRSRSTVVCGGLHHGAARHADHLSVVPAARPLRHHRDARRRRDRDAGHPQLGQPDARPDRADGAFRRSRCSARRSSAARGSTRSRSCALIVLALLQMAAARLASRPHAARHPRRRRGGALLRHRARPLQEPRLRRRAAFPPASRGALMAHIFSYVNHETFTSQVSLLALTMVILGGLGNIAGAILGAVAAGQPARAVPRRRRIPHADLRHRAAAADPLPAAGPVGDGVMAHGSAARDHGPDAPLRRRHRRRCARRSTVAEGELVSIIGPNGAGKTTLFNLVTGLDRPDAGSVTFAGRDITGLPAEKLAAARPRAHVPARPRVRQSERARQRAGRRAHAACARCGRHGR